MSFQGSSESSVIENFELNYPARKNIKIHILRNGLATFKGIWFPTSIAKYSTFKIFLTDVTVALKKKIFINKGGVRALLSTDGNKIMSLEELDDGKTYIATCLNEKFKYANYQLNTRPVTDQSRDVRQSGTLTCSAMPTLNVDTITTRVYPLNGKCDSSVSLTNTTSCKPSNISICYSKSTGNISGKSLGSLPLGAISPRTVISEGSMIATSGPTSRSKVSGSSKTSVSDAGCNRRPCLTNMVTKTGRSASTAPKRSTAISREVSSSRPKGNVAHLKADAKQNVVGPRTAETASTSTRTGVMSCESRYTFRNQWITVLRHGKKPRTSYRILLDRTTPNFSSIMKKIVRTLKLSSDAKVFSDTCVVTSRYEDFFQHDYIFLAFPSKRRIQWNDFNLHLLEEDIIARQNSILSFGLMDKVSGDLPKCISSIYNICQTISYGCYSLIVQCNEKSTKRNFAMKVVYKMRGNDAMEANVRKNRTGIDFLSTMKHLNILTVYFQHETIGALYVIVDYFNGGDLHKLVERSPKILENEAWNFIGDIMCALHYLHSENIVHRHICALHLMVNISHSGSRRLKLTEFGLATRMTDEPLTDAVGFLLYMAPEMIERKRYGYKVDVWGAGITLYYILTKTLPFHMNSVEESGRKIVNSDGVSFKGAEWDSVSFSMKSLISAMLKNNERHRYTAEDVCDIIHKHDVELDIDSSTEEEQESKETIPTAEVPDNIFDPFLVQKWINKSSKFMNGESWPSEHEMNRSNTSDPSVKCSTSSVELSCMPLLSSTSSFSYTRRTYKCKELSYESCSGHTDTEISDASDEKGTVSVYNVPNDRKEYLSCLGFDKKLWPDISETEIQSMTLDSEVEYDHRGVTEDWRHQELGDNERRAEDEHREEIVFQGIGDGMLDTILIDVGVLRSDAYKPSTTSKACRGTVVEDKIKADFRCEGYKLLQKITERRI